MLSLIGREVRGQLQSCSPAASWDSVCSSRQELELRLPVSVMVHTSILLQQRRKFKSLRGFDKFSAFSEGCGRGRGELRMPEVKQKHTGRKRDGTMRREKAFDPVILI